ncbi:MAG: hypothetical protein P4L56_00910 [Candidatus Sulfopaludibacter sp.]|nr:hypothetical protein [Candidatus Sulfopaludibacter sp.]
MIFFVVVRFPTGLTLSQLDRPVCTEALIENFVAEFAETVKLCAAGADPPTAAVNDSDLTLMDTLDPEPSSAKAIVVHIIMAARSGAAMCRCVSIHTS